MPKIADKRKVLGGRGSVVLYASGTSAGKYFYRELIKGTQTYKTRRIEGVSNMDEAEAAVTEVAFELNKEPPDLSLVFGKRGSGGASDTPRGGYVEIYFESGSSRIRFKKGVTLQSLLDEKLENKELKVLSPGTRFL